ncbi:MAG: hypothetical protein SFU53_07360 [Terrimicrobiaceae bacterium]|nr:hypothetical protein [Terrimicrobiaceae bacterium]
MSYRTALVLVIVAILGMACETLDSAWSDSPNYRYPLEIPTVPSDAMLVIYGPIPPGLGGKEGETSKDWVDIFRAMGVSFPQGGFAIFYPPARILAVATDRENQERVAAICE